MKVCIYSGCLQLVRRSGVGQAMLHQKKMLEDAGVPVSFRDGPDTDVVHINTVFPDAVCKAFWAHLQRKKVLYYGHSTAEDFKISFRGSNALTPLFRRWIRFCYNRGNAVVTPTEYSRRLLLECGVKRPVYVLSNGVDTARFCPDAEKRARFREKYGLAAGEKAVLSVGHYIERKGLLEFVQLARANPQYRFFWFGYTDLRLVPDVIREAVASAPKNLSFPGYVENDELRDAYCGCDLFLFMSREETEGIVVLEALASGIPVALRDIPVYEGWLRDRVNVYKCGGFVDFQRQMDGVLNGTLPDLREAGRKTAEQRDLNRTGRMLTDIYRELLGAPEALPEALCR